MGTAEARARALLTHVLAAVLGDTMICRPYIPAIPACVAISLSTGMVIGGGERAVRGCELGCDACAGWRPPRRGDVPARSVRMKLALRALRRRVRAPRRKKIFSHARADIPSTFAFDPASEGARHCAPVRTRESDQNSDLDHRMWTTARSLQPTNTNHPTTNPVRSIARARGSTRRVPGCRTATSPKTLVRSKCRVHSCLSQSANGIFLDDDQL